MSVQPVAGSGATGEPVAMSHPPTPREIYAGLFELVQSTRIFKDSKTFVDAIPREAPQNILQHFRSRRYQPDFDLKSFVYQHFVLPDIKPAKISPASDSDVRAGIEQLWSKLTRAPDPEVQHSSLIELPKPYVVPGGRFRELYYWDSYFTMLGLAESGELGLVADMLDNFAYLIDRIGFIPNGNRSYYCTRSQPPFFVMMIELLAAATADESVYTRYFSQLKKEYEFWMSGADRLDAGQGAFRRVAKFGDALLNRYWDDAELPREESYAEDIALARLAGRDAAGLYRDVRAACESGWDFGSRWFENPLSIATIRTTGILPIDLNSILHRMEAVLGAVSARNGNRKAADFYKDRAERRKSAIQSAFFDEREGFFVDLTLADRSATKSLSLAAAYPLFFGLATQEQAESVAKRLERDFLRPGGWVTTLSHTYQQWDAPNGWAPLQWIVFKGLCDYGFEDEAKTGAARWIENNVVTYRDSGRFMEKYNVENPGLAATGGEYAVQDGFGWTNGVLLCLQNRIR